MTIYTEKCSTNRISVAEDGGTGHGSKELRNMKYNFQTRFTWS